MVSYYWDQLCLYDKSECLLWKRPPRFSIFFPPSLVHLVHISLPLFVWIEIPRAQVQIRGGRPAGGLLHPVRLVTGLQLWSGPPLEPAGHRAVQHGLWLTNLQQLTVFVFNPVYHIKKTDWLGCVCLCLSVYVCVCVHAAMKVPQSCTECFGFFRCFVFWFSWGGWVIAQPLFPSYPNISPTSTLWSFLCNKSHSSSRSCTVSPVVSTRFKSFTCFHSTCCITFLLCFCEELRTMVIENPVILRSIKPHAPQCYTRCAQNSFKAAPNAKKYNQLNIQVRPCRNIRFNK